MIDRPCDARTSGPTTGSRATALVLSLFVVLACQEQRTLDEIRELQRLGQWAETVEPLRAWVAERPDDAEAAFLYGRALVSTGRPSLALWPLRRAMKDPEWLRPAGYQLAHAALYSRDFNETVDVATRILEVHPDDETALLYRAQAHAHWKSDPLAALEDAQRVLEIDRDVIEAYEPLILALLALERREEAEEALAEAGARLEEVGAAPAKLAWHCSTTAVFALDVQDVARAREILEGCLERFSADPNVVFQAVSVYDQSGEIESSERVLRRALDQTPGNRFFRTALAERLRLSGRAADGEAVLLEATEREADESAAPLSSAWLDLAKYRHAIGESGRAAEAIAEAIEAVRRSGQEPGPALLFRYADALLVSGELDRALEVGESLSVPAQRELIRARVTQERGRHAEALAIFDEVLRVWPDNAAARYYTAVSAEQVGDFDRALEEYRYSIRISVGATDARTRGAQLLLSQGRPLHAYQMLFVEAGKHPLEPEGELLSMYLMGRVANPAQLQNALLALSRRSPERVALALARGAEGAAETAGPMAAVQLIASAPGLDLADPAHAAALRALVRFAHAAGQPEIAERAVEAALARHPGSGPQHAIRGLHLELGGADEAAVREAYTRATELDPSRAWGWAGLGRAVQADDPERALDLFERAIRADPSDPELQLAAARVLRRLGRPTQAAERLDALLRAHPHAWEAARERAGVDLEQGRVGEATLERARRVARFHPAPASFELLAQVHTELGQPEAAAAARTEAERIRRRQRAAASETRSGARPRGWVDDSSQPGPGRASDAPDSSGSAYDDAAS